MTYPILVPQADEYRSRAITELRVILDAAETVDSYTIDYTKSAIRSDHLVVDHEFVRSEKVGDVLRVLAELDAIAGSDQPADPHSDTGRLLVDTQDRARVLAIAIRACLVPPPHEVEDDAPEAPAAPRPAHEHTGFEAGAL